MRMDENETFRENLLRIMADQGLKAAELSKRAKLNVRAVKDIEERRAISPKLSTVFALAKALKVDAAELMGLGPRPKLSQELVQYLSAYDADEQRSILQALSALPNLRT